MDPIVRRAMDQYKSLCKRVREIDARANAEKAELAPRMEQLETFLRIADTIELPEQTSLLPVQEQQRETFKDSVIAATKRMLSDGKRMRTRDIVAALEAMGITVPGNNPSTKVLRVSLLLSREKAAFDSNRAHGWALI